MATTATPAPAPTRITYGSCYLCHGKPLHPRFGPWRTEHEGYKARRQDRVFLCAPCRRWLSGQHIAMLERAVGHRIGEEEA